jgi:hypothetical protein
VDFEQDKLTKEIMEEANKKQKKKKVADLPQYMQEF